MCGIVCAVAQREVREILLEGLKRLEYRGYDSAGMAIVSPERNQLQLIRSIGKVAELVNATKRSKATGRIGLAHTRWATHGRPTKSNAHPHVSCNEIAVVHNGIIENYESLRSDLKKRGYKFTSDTDTEVISHFIHYYVSQTKVSLLQAVKKVTKNLQGAYGLCALDKKNPNQIVAARSGSPLIIGVGIGENFVASDPLALGQVTDRFIYLEEGDIASISLDEVSIWNKSRRVERTVTTIPHNRSASDKGKFQHFMLKEIYEQPTSIRETLTGRISKTKVLEQAFGLNAEKIFKRVRHVQIVACGTSYHAGLIAKYWLESVAKLPCQVDIASDYRYRSIVSQPGTLFVTISQSGETADTLAALKYSKKYRYVASLSICNVATSALVRESDLCLLTMAGKEVGVASTKAFTTQLSVLLLLAIVLGRRSGLSVNEEKKLVSDLNQLPNLLEKTLKLNNNIKAIAKQFSKKNHSLFLGRGIQYPVAKEGALKLKEISYIHAEAYQAGELKHGPLALVDSKMPVIAVAPNNDLLGKLKANLSEVSARGGKLYVFADERIKYKSDKSCKVINVPSCPEILAPLVFTIPLQLLAYHVALTKGTDVDHPRNLAKSVTVE
ncbi:glutamine--fructose-6-phosphate transaminase (isomerizing) [OM182 bacterium]|nr:glutamine--fructose-6-phosphate transaminase (isomerizing) [OM182 bacterium]